MTDILLLVSAIAILQVGGAYVRYTPFAGIMDDKTKRRLFYADCLVLLINMSWQSLLIDQLGVGGFPEQEVRQPLLARGAHDHVDRRRARGGQALPQRFLIQRI